MKAPALVWSQKDTRVLNELASFLRLRISTSRVTVLHFREMTTFEHLYACLFCDSSKLVDSRKIRLEIDLACYGMCIMAYRKMTIPNR